MCRCWPREDLKQCAFHPLDLHQACCACYMGRDVRLCDLTCGRSERVRERVREWERQGEVEKERAREREGDRERETERERDRQRQRQRQRVKIKHHKSYIWGRACHVHIVPHWFGPSKSLLLTLLIAKFRAWARFRIWGGRRYVLPHGSFQSCPSFKWVVM